MTGTVAVGLVVVSGPTTALAFSDDEKVKVVSEVIRGLQFLAESEPGATLNFMYSITWVTVHATPPTGICGTPEPCEAVWRDPALRAMGYPSGMAGCTAFADALQQRSGVDWSYVAFFTKYPQYWFAYASAVRLCMQYNYFGQPGQPGKWTVDDIHRIFAHETCHIFGAADEYGSCECGASGQNNVPNSNCVNCVTPGTAQLPCLMDHNVLTICEWSRGQIGWSYWHRVNTAFLLSTIVVASDGTVAGIDEGGDIRTYDGPSTGWQAIAAPPESTGVFKSLALRSARELFAIDTNGDCFHLLDGVWDQYAAGLPDGGLAKVAVSMQGSICALDNSGNIYGYYALLPNPQNAWRRFPGNLSAIAVGALNSYWGVNSAGKIYQSAWPPNGWTAVAGTLADISVAADGTMWGTTSAGEVMRFVGGPAPWQNVTGSMARIAVGSASDVWALDSGGDIYQRVFTTG